MGWAAEWGGMGGGKNHRFGHPMSSHDAHTVANDTIMGHIVSGIKPRSPLPNWCPAIVPAVTLEDQKIALHKSRPVNI